MADAVTSQTLVDGRRNVVMKFTNVSDGTGESAATKVDVSALNHNATEVRIDRVWYDVSGMIVELLWDATTDVVSMTLSGQGYLDFRCFGGIRNNAGAGKTGDLLFTTTGHTAGDTYTVILEMAKS